MIDYRQLGARIHEIRTRKKLSQEKLAELADISRQSVSRVENARKKVNIESLVAIASALNVSLDELVHGTQPDPEPSPPQTDRTTQLLLRLCSDLSPNEKKLLLATAKSLRSALRECNVFL